VASAIARAAQEVEAGQWDDQFVVDVFQTGSGTSTHMNANEVIAIRADELLQGRRVAPKARRIHPNDHVNRGQSSNDVMPSATHVAVMVRLNEALLPALDGLTKALEERSRKFADATKPGRTHLQDAVPVTFGGVFGGWARQVALGQARILSACERLFEIPLGGTAVGTGLNARADVTAHALATLVRDTGIPFRRATNPFEAQGARDALVEMSGALRTVAVSLTKIANDVRWLSSGPRCGLAELRLPVVQPGSSMMPGKVNPVMAEALAMACAQVLGLDAAIVIAGQSGNLELNAMVPLLALDVLDEVHLLAGSVSAFTERCILGLDVDRERAAALAALSLALTTALAPAVGHDQAAAIAEQAQREGKTILAVAIERGVLPEAKLRTLLDPGTMAAPEGTGPA
jgi:fumarate hydratase class II